MIIPNISYLKELPVINENIASVVVQSNESNSNSILHNNQDSNGLYIFYLINIWLYSYKYTQIYIIININNITKFKIL